MNNMEYLKRVMEVNKVLMASGVLHQEADDEKKGGQHEQWKQQALQ
jgi:hypothetical protein